MKNDYNSQYEVKGHNLGLMCEFYGIEHGELHRADVDALATGKLLVAMMKDTERVRKAKRNSRMAKDLEFDIVEHIGVLAEKKQRLEKRDQPHLMGWCRAKDRYQGLVA